MLKCGLVALALVFGACSSADAAPRYKVTKVQGIKRVILVRPHWRNIYARETHPACVEAWRVSAEGGGPSGMCVPLSLRGAIERLAPYGSKTAVEFYREQERNFGGGTVD